MQAIDVLIVGAGPVGLALAIELETAGVHAVVMDQRTEIDPVPKARGVGVLGSEALRRRGLSVGLQRRDHELRRQFRREMGSDRGHFAWIHKLDANILGGDETRMGALIEQPDLERLLADRAVGLGADVRRAHRIIELHREDTGVHVTVETPTGTHRYTASYLVGCDGGRSSIRKSAGFAFPGTDSAMLMRVARVKPARPADFPDRVRTARGTLQYREIRDGWVRIRLSEPEGDEPRDRSPVTLAEIQHSLERITGTDVALVDMQDARRIRDSSRQATTYRMGRVLLAGDAAHIHSPAGGQGLNLGIMDAVNLGWKLAAVITGVCGDNLLDTYTRERHPVGARVIANTLAQAALLDQTPQTEALRAIFSDLMDIPPVQTYLGRMLSGLDVRYRLPYSVAAEHHSIGTHLPDFVVDDTTLYALMSDGRPLLLTTPEATDAAATTAAWADRVHIVPALLLGHRDLAAALIRTDGLLAWAATPGTTPDHDGLRTALETWFGQPLPMTAGR